jgi:hypothetical protein
MSLSDIPDSRFSIFIDFGRTSARYNVHVVSNPIFSAFSYGRVLNGGGGVGLTLPSVPLSFTVVWLWVGFVRAMVLPTTWQPGVLGVVDWVDASCPSLPPHRFARGPVCVALPSRP